MAKKESAEKAVRDIRRKTRRRFSAEEKIRIVIEACVARVGVQRHEATRYLADARVPRRLRGLQRASVTASQPDPPVSEVGSASEAPKSCQSQGVGSIEVGFTSLRRPGVLEP